MKRASLLINIILLVVFTNTLAFAGHANFDSNDVTGQTVSYQFLEAYGASQAIPTSSTKTVDAFNIAGFSTFAIHNVVASAGTPTFEFQSVDQAGNIVSTASMTEGTDITNIDGANCKVLIINGEAAPITISYSILIAD